MAALLRTGESFATATIFDNVGSAPRTNGAKMLVKADSSISGSIGGGRLEADVIRTALSCRQTVIHSFDLSSRDVAGMDMICGGKGDVLIDFVDAADANNRTVYEAAADIIAQGKKAWLITILKNDPAGTKRQQCLVKPDKTLIGKIDCDPYMLEKLLTGPAKISIHAEVLDNQRFLVEPLRPTGTLYIFGAGHVSQCIAPLSVSVGFKPVVLDDRAEYANRDRFAETIEVRLIDNFRQLPQLAIDENSYLVIVTRGHLYDRVVLEQVLRSDAAYIGMIGSRSKRDKLFAEMINQGYGKEELARVYAPIGTNIGAETPEELAVSIVGELIKIRAARESENRIESNASGRCCLIKNNDLERRDS
jgi:xanthine dehydrogenase accessory factor